MSPSVNDDTSLADRIERGQTELFGHLPAQLEYDDKRSLLALHGACRAEHGQFAYLEVGSHLGGSLQVLVRDPACRAILSIDPRPAWQPDQRGMRFGYPDNSTTRMLELLAGVPQAAIEKVHTYDTTTAQLDPSTLADVPHLCFIDGEHTDSAVLTDARFCLRAMRGTGCIAFHDAAVVYNGISQFLDELEQAGTEHTPYVLPSMVFVVEVGPPSLRTSPHVTSMILENYRGYLFSLKATEPYRDFYNSPLFRRMRRFKGAIRRNPVFR